MYDWQAAAQAREWCDSARPRDQASTKKLKYGDGVENDVVICKIVETELYTVYNNTSNYTEILKER